MGGTKQVYQERAENTNLLGKLNPKHQNLSAIIRP